MSFTIIADSDGGFCQCAPYVFITVDWHDRKHSQISHFIDHTNFLAFSFSAYFMATCITARDVPTVVSSGWHQPPLR